MSDDVSSSSVSCQVALLLIHALTLGEVSNSRAEPFRGNIAAGTDRTLWVETRGTGPSVLLLGGLTDTVESWQFQLDGLSDRYHLIAFDNAGAGRSPLPRESEAFDSGTMAEDAVTVLRSVGVDGPVHVAGFSGGAQIGQQLALRHPEFVRSMVLVSTWARQDAYFRTMLEMFRWLIDAAPSERAALEAFFLWIYTPRAHDDGTVAAIIEEALATPSAQPPESFRRQLEAFTSHFLIDELHRITVPTLVVAGGLDIAAPPRYGEAVAGAIPGAVFEVWEAEAHQPFQEVPDAFNARVDAFWRSLDAR
jgi:pimeloyl-ACP methyl ester carboxylesterase